MYGRKASQAMRHVSLVEFPQRFHVPQLAGPTPVFCSRGLYFDENWIILDHYANVSVPNRIRQVAENAGTSAVHEPSQCVELLFKTRRTRDETAVLSDVPVMCVVVDVFQCEPVTVEECDRVAEYLPIVDRLPMGLRALSEVRRSLTSFRVRTRLVFPNAPLCKRYLSNQ